MSFSVRLVAAVAISFLLFTSIPLVRGLIGYGRPEKRQLSQRNRVIAEMVRTPPKKEGSPVKMMRQVTAPSSGQAGGREAGGLSFKIAPDLGVEGGGGVAVNLQGQDLEAMVFDEGQTDENVVALSTPPIPYPQRAKELGIQGTLEAVITIDRDGTVAKVDIVKSPHQSIAEATKKVIKTWQFKPAKIKGIPVKVRRFQTIEFKLDSE